MKFLNCILIIFKLIIAEALGCKLQIFILKSWANLELLLNFVKEASKTSTDWKIKKLQLSTEAAIYPDKNSYR